MKLFILGKSNDDKGTQLEELTSAILEDIGYTYVCRNYIGSGGNEIDIKAKKVSTILGKQVELPVVCECKAYSAPITTTDWLKFLGKVHIERMSNAQTEGVLIALSGANGNVVGNYESLPDKSYIHLVTHDNLIHIVCKHFNIKKAEEVKSFIEHKTIRVVDTIDLIYFEKQIYWLVGFTNGDFNVMTNNLFPIDSLQLDRLLTLLENESTFEKSKYVDILGEDIARYRREIISKSIVYILMDQGVSIELSNMIEFVKQLCQQPDIDTQEVIEAAQHCPYTLLEDNIIKFKNEEDIDFPAFYRWYTHGQIIVNSIAKPFYNSHINDQLLEDILHIQNDLTIPNEKRTDVLEILRISPNALAYALHPDFVITSSRAHGASNIPEIDEHHVAMFINNLTDFLIADLQNGEYSYFYYTEFGLRNYSIESTLSLKYADQNKNKTIEDKKYFGLIEAGDQIVTCSLRAEIGKRIMSNQSKNRNI